MRLIMFYYNRNDLSEGVNPFNGKECKECIVFHYWFLIMGLSFIILPVIAVINGRCWTSILKTESATIITI